jgi:acetyl-CoA C-acetyltransferase
VARSVAASGKRVALVASSSWSHAFLHDKDWHLRPDTDADRELYDAMVRGDYDLALVTGAEALDTVRRAKKRAERLPWSHRDPEKKPFPFEAMPHPAEVAHEVFQAWLTFPVFDVARRAQRGESLAAYAEGIGAMMAPMTEIAVKNPYAWFPIARSASELVTATPDNRYVGWPYTKWIVSVMDVDMAAAAIVATHETAESLGVPPERRVYLRGWAYGTDPWVLAEREQMWASPAMAATSRAALGTAGAGVDDVAHFDLYSCFASSLHLACDALGIAPTDDRGLSVTGGLPYHGGPASGYLTHSIAAIVERLRADGIPAAVSRTAGDYLCNHVFYALMHLLATERPGTIGGFVHVPLLPEQSPDGRLATLGRDALVRGVVLTVETAALHARTAVAAPA